MAEDDSSHHDSIITTREPSRDESRQTENGVCDNNDDIEKGGKSLEKSVSQQTHPLPATATDNALDLVQSHISHQDMHATTTIYREENAEQYLRFSSERKVAIVVIVSFCSFLAPISSTSILSAVPEVAATYNTTGSLINASNAIYMLCMGLAATVWGPLSQVWGRRPVSWSSTPAYISVSYSYHMG
jgi:hypothetical protein